MRADSCTPFMRCIVRGGPRRRIGSGLRHEPRPTTYPTDSRHGATSASPAWPGCYTGAVTDSYFQSVGSGLSPFPHAHAPWGEDMLHGRLLGGLAARALESEHGAAGWRAARLTVDLFRPAPMALVEIDVRPIRAGRRIKVSDALMRCDGHDVGRATAVFLAESEEPPGRIWRPRHEPWPDPDSIATSEAGSPDHAGWLFRVVRGGFGTSEQTRIWTRETTRLVDDEPLSQFVARGADRRHRVSPRQQLRPRLAVHQRRLHDAHRSLPRRRVGRSRGCAADRREWHLDGLGHARRPVRTVRHQRWRVAGATPDGDSAVGVRILSRPSMQALPLLGSGPARRGRAFRSRGGAPVGAWPRHGSRGIGEAPLGLAIRRA